MTNTALEKFYLKIKDQPMRDQLDAIAQAALEGNGHWTPRDMAKGIEFDEINIFGVSAFGESAANAGSNWIHAAGNALGRKVAA